MGESKWEHRKTLYECIHKSDWNKDEIPDYEMKLFDINSDSIMPMYLSSWMKDLYKHTVRKEELICAKL